ncbi:hypothetical protein [Halomontanus rarus]|uniref:hypothetical protein n=1 Tax=Halomontanus rarus TaxID=3034020 RepID=UPI00293BE94E|nr:hypothetical protein [Halovivax sp. KZCA124]
MSERTRGEILTTGVTKRLDDLGVSTDVLLLMLRGFYIGCFEQFLEVLEIRGLLDQLIEVVCFVVKRFVDECDEFIAINISIRHLLGQCFTKKPGRVETGCPVKKQHVSRHD